MYILMGRDGRRKERALIIFGSTWRRLHRRLSVIRSTRVMSEQCAGAAGEAGEVDGTMEDGRSECDANASNRCNPLSLRWSSFTFTTEGHSLVLTVVRVSQIII